VHIVEMCRETKIVLKCTAYSVCKKQDGIFRVENTCSKLKLN
jgi:hypothetical protein